MAPFYHIHPAHCGADIVAVEDTKEALWARPWDDTSYSYHLSTGLPCSRVVQHPSLWLLLPCANRGSYPGPHLRDDQDRNSQSTPPFR